MRWGKTTCPNNTEVVYKGEDKRTQETIQYNTIQYNTIQYNGMQCNAMQCNAIQYNTIRYDTIQYNKREIRVKYVRWGKTTCPNNTEVV